LIGVSSIAFTRLERIEANCASYIGVSRLIAAWAICVSHGRLTRMPAAASR
jgi:hypothetical protein